MQLVLEDAGQQRCVGHFHLRYLKCWEGTLEMLGIQLRESVAGTLAATSHRSTHHDRSWKH